jgi:hypothetical protein
MPKLAISPQLDILFVIHHILFEFIKLSLPLYLF